MQCKLLKYCINRRKGTDSSVCACVCVTTSDTVVWELLFSLLSAAFYLFFVLRFRAFVSLSRHTDHSYILPPEAQRGRRKSNHVRTDPTNRHAACWREGMVDRGHLRNGWSRLFTTPGPPFISSRVFPLHRAWRFNLRFRVWRSFGVHL